MKRFAALLVIAACSAPTRAPVVLANHAPPPAPPSPSRPLLAGSAMAQVIGEWRGVDDDQWTYVLVIRASGRFTQKVIQASGTICDQAGTMTEEPGGLVRTFDSDTCSEGYVGKSVHDRVESIEHAHLVLRMESDYLIRYDRAP